MVGNQVLEIVLLSGKLVRDSLDLLVTGGRFLEIGKRKISTEVEMREEQPDVTYFTHTLNELIPENPTQVRNMLTSLTVEVESGLVQAFLAKIYKFQSGVVDALQRLRSGTTVGKMFISFEEMCDDIGIAIITCGLGVLGLVNADIIVDMGADQVELVSQSGQAKEYEGTNLQERLRRLIELKNGELVSVEWCDMYNEVSVQSVLRVVRQRHGQINTIMHTSGVVIDGWLYGMNTISMSKVCGPKTAGAWYLHKHSMEDDIRHFVVLFSVSEMFGNPRLIN